MAGLKDLSSVWKNIKEIDLKPIREAAANPVRIALVGAPGSGRHTLAEQMRTDPTKPGIHTQSLLAIISTEAANEPPAVDLIIVLVDATQANFLTEQTLVKRWYEGGKNVLVLVNKIDMLEGKIIGDDEAGWSADRVLFGSMNDIGYLQREFIPAVLELLPQQHVALSRQFPLFRIPVARQLINEACYSNAAYSLSTGLAEIVPVLDLPLNVTDMVVLTKSQAFLAYKLGLVLGFSTRWQDYISEFGSVIGTGFVWRQIARGLIGLVPGWGIVPKVAIAYSGTYVVGNAILGWYLTGKNLSPKQMRALSAQAFTRGKEYAQNLAKKIPRPRLGRRKQERLPAPPKRPGLAQGETVIIKTATGPDGEDALAGEESQGSDAASQAEGSSTRVGTGKPGKKKKVRAPKKVGGIGRQKEIPAPAPVGRVCPACGKSSSEDAIFCQYCGTRLES